MFLAEFYILSNDAIFLMSREFYVCFEAWVEKLNFWYVLLLTVNKLSIFLDDVFYKEICSDELDFLYALLKDMM